MAITIAANFSKKVPIPGITYASQQASITITAEVADLAHINVEAKRIYALAEAAVDDQLKKSSSSTPTSPTQQHASAPTNRRQDEQRPSTASTPYKATRQRELSQISPAQLTYIQRLMDKTKVDLADILKYNQISNLRQLTTRQASDLITALADQPAAA